MKNTTTWNATLTDRGQTCAHSGTALATRPVGAFVTPRIKGAVAPMSASTFVPAYVADQESHPPREHVG